jgi:hypothetical protein
MTFLPRWLVIVGALVIAVPLLNAGLGEFIFGVAFVVKGSYAFAAAALPLGLAACGAAGYVLIKAWNHEQRETPSQEETARAASAVAPGAEAAPNLQAVPDANGSPEAEAVPNLLK